ncbi:hypothetical protein RE628_26475 [Paenibacillus sp. D2_2]|uniref:hypothetical protein n=1 Tax=Paenibacillus sp. D2_2 TaxID=3073092 RepID=UPI002814C551|nr:hypothetical protein [Paenibacillus sp. D2_2]WMT40648.1 hypothetical protein RE628_26475 [Paenibacillus sp. D2_2]
MKGIIKRLYSLVEVRTMRNRLFILFAVMFIVPNVLIAYSSFESSKKQLQVQTDEIVKVSATEFEDTLDRVIEAQVQNLEQLVMEIDSKQIDSKSPELIRLIELFKEKHRD